MKTWSVGIIGAGNIADCHAMALESITNADLKGICDTNSETVQKLAGKYSCPVFPGSTEMLQSPDVDIIIVATPSGAHKDPVMEAARYGKHVLCEKPLEISLERIDEMIKAHEISGTRLGGIFNYRFNDVVRVLKDAVDRGRFGTITNASVFVPWWRNDAYYENSWRGTWKLDGGGALMNQSIHMVDMLQYMLGPVDSLQAYTATLGHPQIEVEDTAVAILRFKNNALGMIHGSTASFPGQFRRLEITGTRGTAVMEEDSLKLWQFAKPETEDDNIIKRFGTIEGGGGVSDPMSISYKPHARNITAFISAIEDDRPFEIDGAEARKSVEIILGIYRSARQKKEIVFS